MSWCRRGSSGRVALFLVRRNPLAWVPTAVGVHTHVSGFPEQSVRESLIEVLFAKTSMYSCEYGCQYCEYSYSCSYPEHNHLLKHPMTSERTPKVAT